jgi:HPt (histidine-containing phosphotransfer) domain-containing protein
MDLKELADQLGLTEEECADFIRLFIDTSTVELKNLKSAVLDRARTDALAIAHSLKGAALNMKLDAFSETARKMETAIRNSQWQAADQLINQFSELLEELIWAIR